MEEGPSVKLSCLDLVNIFVFKNSSGQPTKEIEARKLSTGTGGFTNRLLSGTKKEHKPKLLSSDIFRWGRGLPREGVGAKSSICPSKPGKSNFFGGISRKCPKSLRKKVRVQFSAPILGGCPQRFQGKRGFARPGRSLRTSNLICWLRACQLWLKQFWIRLGGKAID